MDNYDNNQNGGRPQVVVAPSAPPKERNNLAIASMIVGILALISCCCSILGVVLSIVGIVLVILSKKGKPLSGFAIAGLILSILGLVGSLVFFAYYIFALKMSQDPQFGPMMNEMNQIMEKYLNTVPTN